MKQKYNSIVLKKNPNKCNRIISLHSNHFIIIIITYFNNYNDCKLYICQK